MILHFVLTWKDGGCVSLHVIHKCSDTCVSLHLIPLFDSSQTHPKNLRITAITCLPKQCASKNTHTNGKSTTPPIQQREALSGVLHTACATGVRLWVMKKATHFELTFGSTSCWECNRLETYSWCTLPLARWLLKIGSSSSPWPFKHNWHRWMDGWIDGCMDG